MPVGEGADRLIQNSVPLLWLFFYPQPQRLELHMSELPLHPSVPCKRRTAIYRNQILFRSSQAPRESPTAAAWMGQYPAFAGYHLLKLE